MQEDVCMRCQAGIGMSIDKSQARETMTAYANERTVNISRSRKSQEVRSLSLFRLTLNVRAHDSG